MSHLFDEGGAGGMLLYNLSLQPASGCRIAFGDSGSAETEKSDEVGGQEVIDISSLLTRVERAINELHPGNSISDMPLLPELSELRQDILQTGHADLASPSSKETRESSGRKQKEEDNNLNDVLAEVEEEEEYEAGGGEALDDSFGDDDNGMPFGFSASPMRSDHHTAAPVFDLLVDDEYAFFDMKYVYLYSFISLTKPQH
jgi:hypothetical protein